MLYQRKTTPAQSEASRRNGSLSQGPTTPAGKANSSLNSIRHGASSQTVVLSNENPELFELLLNDMIQEFQPETPAELRAVQEMAVHKWRQNRLFGLQTTLVDFQMDRDKPEIDKTFQSVGQSVRTNLALQNTQGAWESYARNEIRLDRAYYRAFRHLAELKEHRKKLNLSNEPDNLLKTQETKESEKE